MAKHTGTTTATVAAVGTAPDVIRAAGTEIIQLPPTDIKWDETTNVRPWEDATQEKEQKRIADLAKSIVIEGQLQPIVVREIDTATGFEYHGIAGRRRTAAVLYGRDILKHTDLMVNCLVLRGVDDESAFRKSLTENFKRLQMSSMDMALNIANIRSRMGWDEDPDWSKKVAKELGGVSRAYVTQKMKLFDLPEDLQRELHEGVISEDAALVAATKLKAETTAAEKTAVVERAKEIAKEEAAKEAASPTPATLTDADGNPLPVTENAAENGGEPTPITGTDTTAADATVLEKKGTHAPVQERHVVAAAREKDALDKPIPLTRKEIVEIVLQFDSPAYGHPNGDVRKFVRCFEDCVKGTGKMKTLKTLFNKMTEKAEQGTPEVKAPEEKLVTKADKAKKAAAGKK